MREGWEIKAIGEIAEITDYVANGSFATLRENVSYLNDKGYAILVRLADYTNNFDAKKYVYIDEHAYNFLAKSKLHGGEIIMSNVGSIGKSFICPDLGMPMSLAPNSIVIKTANNRFFHYVCQSNHFQKEIEKISSKTALPKFNKTSFKTIEISVPPLPEQQKIVEELDCLSNMIELKKKQLETYDKLAQAIFYDMFGESVALRERWTKCRVGDIYTFQYGKGNKIPENIGEYPCYGSNGQVGFHTEYNSEDSPIIGHIGAYAGIVNWANGKHYVTYNGVICKLKNSSYNKVYSYYMLKAQDYIQKARGGAAQPFVSYDILEAPEIYLPPIHLQYLFAEKIEAIEKQKDLIRKSLQEVETLFNSRMDYYFN